MGQKQLSCSQSLDLYIFRTATIRFSQILFPLALLLGRCRSYAPSKKQFSQDKRQELFITSCMSWSWKTQGSLLDHFTDQASISLGEQQFASLSLLFLMGTASISPYHQYHIHWDVASGNPKAALKSATWNRAFLVVAPLVWNSLPPEIRLAPPLFGFRKQVATWIFSQTFNGLTPPPLLMYLPCFCRP